MEQWHLVFLTNVDDQKPTTTKMQKFFFRVPWLDIHIIFSIFAHFFHKIIAAN